MQHHKGNADRRRTTTGITIDWISIYKHGEHGEAEHPLKYTFLSFFREDPKTVFRTLETQGPARSFLGVTELVLFVGTFVSLGILNWHYLCFLLPFWYFGHCLSYLKRLLPGITVEILMNRSRGALAAMRSFIIGYWFYQRLPRRTPLSAKGSLDPDARVSEPDYQAATRSGRARDWTSTRPWLPRSRFAAPSTKEPTATSAIEKLFAQACCAVASAGNQRKRQRALQRSLSVS